MNELLGDCLQIELGLYLQTKYMRLPEVGGSWTSIGSRPTREDPHRRHFVWNIFYLFIYYKNNYILFQTVVDGGHAVMRACDTVEAGKIPSSRAATLDSQKQGQQYKVERAGLSACASHWAAVGIA